MSVRPVVRFARLTLFTLLMLALTGLLLLISSSPSIEVAPFDNAAANRMLSYQLSALPVAGLALVLTYAFAGRIRLGYLRSNRRGAMRLVGRTGGGRWETDGWTIAAAMVVIVGVATFFQLLPGGFVVTWLSVVLAVPFAALNAFTEETVFRLPYVTVGDDQGARAYGLVMGSLVFGVVHYWGVAPNGLVGAAMSAVLGYVLAKSIQETRGFFWAFGIHFALNLVGMTLILSQAP
jgi:uncharacterized protein